MQYHKLESLTVMIAVVKHLQSVITTKYSMQLALMHAQVNMEGGGAAGKVRPLAEYACA